MYVCLCMEYLQQEEKDELHEDQGGNIPQGQMCQGTRDPSKQIQCL